MNRRDTDELARWMAAEQAGSLDDADAWFGAVLSRHLPRVVEPAGLVARVMAALPRTATVGWFGAVFDAVGSWWVRATVAAAVAVLGFTLAGVSLGQLLAFSAHSVEVLARLALGVSTSLSAAFGVVAASLALLVDLGRAAMVLATSGPAPAVIGANVLLACLAFAGLSRLLSPREEYL
jgi:hypothetical protein